jgi:hypothetical protein
VINANGNVIVRWTQTDTYANVYKRGSLERRGTVVTGVPGGSGSGQTSCHRFGGNGVLIADAGPSPNTSIRRFTAGYRMAGARADGTSSTAASLSSIAFDSAGNGIAVWAQGTAIYARNYSGGTWAPQVTLSSSGIVNAPRLYIDPGQRDRKLGTMEGRSPTPRVTSWGMAGHRSNARLPVAGWSRGGAAASINAAGQAVLIDYQSTTRAAT